MIKKIALLLLFILVIIQFIHPEKNQSSGPFPSEISSRYSVPQPVQEILKKSCYDCHSNQTAYPWYNNIQPVAWWLKKHVDDGKAELNFQEFASYPPKKARHKLKEIMEQVNEGEMPLQSYTIIHQISKLDASQINLVSVWAKGLILEINTVNNLPPEEEKKRP
jgi:hypothetical protein